MNKNIICYLKKEINENKISHAFLVETNDCEKLMLEIGQIFKDNKLIPKQDLDNNISVSIIRAENNIIDKEKILDLQKFIITKSVINQYKIYFILNTELMNLSSFNKLLKILEEPSDNVIGFLLTENQNLIIPTIKSRCKKFINMYEVDKPSEYTEILNILKNIKIISYSEIIQLKKQILNNDKNTIINILTDFKKLQIETYENISELAKNYKILDNTIDLIKSNVNLELSLDKMFIEMRK